MARSLLPFGYEYVLIDDGWPADTAHVNASGPSRDANGQIIVSSKRFPSGFKNLTNYIHALGLKVGIYTAVSHWTCGGFVGSLGFEERDARSFVEWGFDFVKHDTCAGYNGEPANECGVGNLRADGFNCIKNSTTTMSKALKRYSAAATPPRNVVYYIDHGNPTSSMALFNPHQRFVGSDPQSASDVSKLATLPNQLGWTWAAGVCDMMKTTWDTYDGWESMLDNLHSSIHLAEYQRVVKGRQFWNMPDMLSMGQGLQSHSQYRAQFLLWSVMGAPLILGADVRSLDATSLALVTNEDVLAVNADPDNIQGSFLFAREAWECWGKPISQRVDSKKEAAAAPAVILVVVNKSTLHDAAVVINVRDRYHGALHPAAFTGSFEVRDVLLGKNLGVRHDGLLSLVVPPMDAVMLQLVPVH